MWPARAPARRLPLEREAARSSLPVEKNGRTGCTPVVVVVGGVPLSPANCRLAMSAGGGGHARQLLCGSPGRVGVLRCVAVASSLGGFACSSTRQGRLAAGWRGLVAGPAPHWQTPVEQGEEEGREEAWQCSVRLVGRRSITNNTTTTGDRGRRSSLAPAKRPCRVGGTLAETVNRHGYVPYGTYCTT